MTGRITSSLAIPALALLLSACGSSPPRPSDNAADNGMMPAVEEVTPASNMVVTSSIAPPSGSPSGSPPSTIDPVTSAIQAQLEAAPITPPVPSALGGATDDAYEEPVQTPAYTGPVREAVTSGQICAAALAMLFGRDPSTMTVVSDSARLARVKYMRSDQTTWTNECRLTDRTVTWRAIGADGPGRWRTEDVITYTASTAGLAMTVNGETRAFAR